MFITWLIKKYKVGAFIVLIFGVGCLISGVYSHLNIAEVDFFTGCIIGFIIIEISGLSIIGVLMLVFKIIELNEEYLEEG